MTDDPIEGARARLEPLIQMLGADGYGLDVFQDGNRLRLEIRATDDACEECLVPKTVMEPMIRDRLASSDHAEVDIVLVYPGESG